MERRNNCTPFSHLGPSWPGTLIYIPWSSVTLSNLREPRRYAAPRGRRRGRRRWMMQEWATEEYVRRFSKMKGREKLVRMKNLTRDKEDDETRRVTTCLKEQSWELGGGGTIDAASMHSRQSANTRSLKPTDSAQTIQAQSQRARLRRDHGLSRQWWPEETWHLSEVALQIHLVNYNYTISHLAQRRSSTADFLKIKHSCANFRSWKKAAKRETTMWHTYSYSRSR